MDRNEMLETLRAIKDPIVSLTAFSDGVMCEYMSSKGRGGFELFDTGDLDAYDYSTPDVVWEDMDNDGLEECINRLKSGEFEPLQSVQLGDGDDKRESDVS